MSEPGNPLWNIHDLASYLNLPVQTIYYWRTHGHGPPARKLGKHLRWHPADVDAWLEQSRESE